MSLLFLQRCFAGLAGADTDNFFQRGDKDLAVPDLARTGGCFNGLDGLFDEIVRDGRFDTKLGQEIDGILSTAIELGMTLLATEALDFGNCQALDSYP